MDNFRRRVGSIYKKTIKSSTKLRWVDEDSIYGVTYNVTSWGWPVYGTAIRIYGTVYEQTTYRWSDGTSSKSDITSSSLLLQQINISDAHKYDGTYEHSTNGNDYINGVMYGSFDALYRYELSIESTITNDGRSISARVHGYVDIYGGSNSTHITIDHENSFDR